MRRAGAGRLRLLPAAVVLAAVLPVAVLAGTVPAIAQPAAADPAAAVAAEATSRATAAAAPLAVTVAAVTPVALTANSTLTVQGTVRNTSARPLTSATISLRSGGVLTSRAAVAQWQSAAPQAFRGLLLRTQRITRPIGPGQVAGFSVTTTAAALGLDPAARTAEPVGLTVSAQGQPESTTSDARTAVVRTFAVWQPRPPADATQAVRLSILVPVTQPAAATDAGSTAAHGSSDWAPTGRLTRLLGAADSPGVSWAVDPALLTAAAAAGGLVPARTPATTTTPSPSPSPVPSAGSGSSSAAGSSNGQPGAQPNPQAKAWLAAVGARARSHDVSALPWGDPDLTALVRAGAAALLTQPDAQGSAAVNGALHRRVPVLFWPAGGRADSTTLHGLAAESAQPVVLDGRSVPGLAVEDDSSGARVDLTVSARRAATRVAPVVLSDPVLSTDLATGGVLATQHLLADLAAVGAEHPGRSMLVTAPRSWNPNPSALHRMVAAVNSASWVTLQPFTRLASAPATEGPRSGTVAYTRQDARRELPTDHVKAVAEAERGLTAFAPALVDASTVVGQLRAQALSLVSLGWRGRSAADLALARTPLTTAVDALYAGLSVDPGSAKNLLAKEGLLPISVRNSLPYRVRVMLVLTPLTGQLSVRRAVSIELDATSSRQFFVPVRAVANGDVFVVASFRTPDGSAVLYQSPRIEVRVRSDWETRGLGFVALLLGLLLFVGLARGVRRGRTLIPPESVPDPDDVGRVAIPDAASSEVVPSEPVPSEPAQPVAAEDAAAATEERAVATTSGGKPSRGRHAERGSTPMPDRGPAGSPALEPSSTAVAAVASSASRGVTATLPRVEQVDLAVEAGSRVEARDDAESASAPVPADGATPTAPPSVPAPGPGPSGAPAAASADAGQNGPDENGSPSPATVAAFPGDAAGTARLMGSSAIMAAGTLMSRILGMVRVVVLAWAIGAAFSANAFSTANTLPNSLFLLIGGGVLNAVLVPQIVAAMQRADGGRDYVDRLLTLSLGLLAVATVVVTAAAPLLLRLFGSPDWNAAQIGVGVAFAFWCLPQVFFYGLYTVLGQVLNARGSFGPYMWAPVVNNVVAIAGTFVFVALYGSGAHPATWWTPAAIAVLAGTTTLGVVAQALILVPVLRRTGFRWRPRRGFRGVGLRSAGSVATWTFAALLVGQLGLVLVSRIANRAGQQAGDAGTGRFVYDTAFLLFILPHSLVAVSVVTAVFTRMSHAVVTDRLDAVRADVSIALRTTGVATVLATVAFVVLGQDLTTLLFATNTRATAEGLAWTTTAMVIGLVPFSAMYLFQRVFYAFGDARTPFWVQVLVISIWSVGNVIAAARLTGVGVVVGIGVAMSVANLVGAVVLAILVRRRIGGVDSARVLSTYLRCAIAAVLAGVLGWSAAAATHLFAGEGPRGALLALVVGGTVLVLAYVTGLRLLRVRELTELSAPLRRIVAS